MKISKALKGAAIVGAVLVAAKGLDDRLETTHYVISSPKIPKAFDGFRIVQVSDIHASVIPGMTDEIRGEAPDIIVSTGDLVHDRGTYEPGITFARRLCDIAPTYAVTGNHDVRRSDYRQFQHDLDLTGVRTLHDESITLSKNGADITLSGIDDPFSHDGERTSDKILASASKIAMPDNYHILLFHRANNMGLLKRKGFDLILSGHMHGGQMRLPNGVGICTPKSSWSGNSPLLFPKYTGGHYRHHDTHMIVNRGTGNTMIIPRFFNRPEVTVIILKAQS